MTASNEEIRAEAETDTRGQIEQLRVLLSALNTRDPNDQAAVRYPSPREEALRLTGLERAINLLENIRSGWETPENVNAAGRAPTPWFAIRIGKPDHHHLAYLLMDARNTPIASIMVLDTPAGRMLAQLLTRAEELAQFAALLHSIADENEIRIGAGTLNVAAATLRAVGIEVKR